MELPEIHAKAEIAYSSNGSLGYF